MRIKPGPAARGARRAQRVPALQPATERARRRRERQRRRRIGHDRVHAERGPVPLSYSTNSFTEAVNRSYATPIYAALAASNPFQAVETGYAGASSDGLTELDYSGSLTSTAPDASNGNVVQTVELGLGAEAAPRRWHSDSAAPKDAHCTPP